MLKKHAQRRRKSLFNLPNPITHYSMDLPKPEIIGVLNFCFQISVQYAFIHVKYLLLKSLNDAKWYKTAAFSIYQNIPRFSSSPCSLTPPSTTYSPLRMNSQHLRLLQYVVRSHPREIPGGSPEFDLNSMQQAY